MKQCTGKENTADPQEENSRWCFSWMECLHSFPQGSDIIHSTTDELWRQITVLIQLQDVLIPNPAQYALRSMLIIQIYHVWAFCSYYDSWEMEMRRRKIQLLGRAGFALKITYERLLDSLRIPGWGHPLDWLARPLNILGDGLAPTNSSPVGR